MIRVYHGPVPFIFEASCREKEELCAQVSERLSQYHCVAEVSTNDLNAAFRLTNTIDSDWWLNPGVQFFGSAEYGKEGARSTSMCDVLECHNGELVVVSAVGFTPLPRPAQFRGNQ